MNHCYDCNSGYTTPGTCNCFAPGGKRYAGTQGGTFAPWAPGFVPIPVMPLQPMIVPANPFPWGTTIGCEPDRTSVALGTGTQTSYTTVTS